MAFCDSGEDDESRICAHPPAEGSSNAQLDLDLTLRPPGPTAEEIERELSSFLSSFGNRGVTSSVLQNTKIKLQLDVASPFEDPGTYAGSPKQTGSCFPSERCFIESSRPTGED
uniref:hypothetical protein n=1 Tax=Bidens tripartita TaxID=51276 RepID=UPI001FF6E85B|nr:hypothetical protein LK193_mgp10 [Bidens tripartita]UIR99029.1 hypothetical protein [Bidens tripartita]